MKPNSFIKINMASVAIVIALLAGVMVGCQKEEDGFWNDGTDLLEFIDIPEMETDSLWFMNKTANKKYHEAMRRFDDQVDLENEYLKVKITRGQEINISEQLFDVFYNGHMTVNQNVKDGKYALMKDENGSIVSVRNKKQIPRLKSGSEGNENDDEWTPVSLSGSSQDVGMALMEALKHYIEYGDIGTLNELIDMASGNFSASNYMRSGTFTYQGYTYTWFVSGYCQANNLPDNCWASVISGSYCTDYQNGQQGGIYRLNNAQRTPAMSIHSSQPGSYTALSNYLSN
jgi:hypothetical protein